MGVQLPSTWRILFGIALCSAACVWFARGVFAPAFFLAPLGVAAYCFSPSSAWVASAAALGANGVITMSAGGFSASGLANSLYFALMVLSFSWIAAPPRQGPSFLRFQAAVRLVMAAALSAAGIIPLLVLGGADSGISVMMRRQAEFVVSVYQSMLASDPVEAAALGGELSADLVLKLMGAIAIRGGALFSTAFFFFINRQAAVIASWLSRRTGRERLSFFHAWPRLIWVLSLSLLVILAGTIFEKPYLEIPGWNLAVFCAILYLIQGGSIVLYFLARPELPFLFRSLANIVIVIIFLSPIVNGIALGVLTLLGIAENWVPFRIPRQKGPSSTPEG
ncbi:MAG: hypothetical protein LBH73_01595 [Spirochaetaceae bacterium]|jgi:hypothetical protein|nr:hypothetical protein [Spirochaetaceae bacterium]